MSESKQVWDGYADDEYKKHVEHEQDQAHIISHLIGRVGELREENAALKHLNKLLAAEINNS